MSRVQIIPVPSVLCSSKKGDLTPLAGQLPDATSIHHFAVLILSVQEGCLQSAKRLCRSL